MKTKIGGTYKWFVILWRSRQQGNDMQAVDQPAPHPSTPPPTKSSWNGSLGGQKQHRLRKDMGLEEKRVLF